MTVQSGATLYIESGAKVTIQGDLISSANIQGPGSILMKGSSLQNINMNGNMIPNLEIDNASNVTLTGGTARIGTSLLFTNGKLLTASQDLILGASASISGYNANRFIWTDGAGQVRKELTADISNYEIPVGFNTAYRPVLISSVGGAYASANIGVRSLGNASANRPPMMANFLQTAWPVTRTGITGGTQTITGQYVDPTDVTGTESNLVGYFYNGTDWSSVGETHDNATNRVSTNLTAASGELTGMNKFITVGSRAFLQGAYNSGNGLMSDALRTGGNVIPLTSPYRSAPYSSTFALVNNPTDETVTSSAVFSNQAADNDNIVDWVFLQLRNTNASPGNAVVQTRSALIQRDGDIVDIDGVSPVTFNNVTDGNYVLSVRHRNHLGFSSDNMNNTNWRSFTEAKSTAFSTNLTDFRTLPASAIFNSGAGGYTTASHPSLGTINMLWAGDVSGNGIIRFQGSNGPAQPNDRVALLQDLGSNEASILNTYQRGDLNMNKITRYQGSNGPLQPNDRLFLLQQVLNSVETTIRTQVLPN